MYAKIFAQIFDSSIAENYEVRHVFEDMLKLADASGVVDMTTEAIARRTNVPIEKVKAGIKALMKTDSESRSKTKGGRRLVALDSGRDWGWIIVNYGHYRQIRDEEARREYFRDAKRRERIKKKPRPARVRGLRTSAAELAAEKLRRNGDEAGAERAVELDGLIREAGRMEGEVAQANADKAHEGV